MTPRPRLPSLSLRPSLRSRASSHSNMLHARSPASGPSSPGGGGSYFMTSASASPSAEMARYGNCTSNPWMNGPGSGYTPTSQLPPQHSQQQQQVSAQQAQTHTQSDSHNRSHRPGTDTRTPTPLSARAGGADIGSYFSPWSSECAHTPPLGSRGTITDGEGADNKTSEQDGFFAHRASHTSTSSISTTSSTAPQIHLQHRHTHAPSRPNLRPAAPRSTVTFPLTMAVAQGKYHPSNYRNPEASDSPATAHSSTNSPIITTTASSPPNTASPLSPPPQPQDTRRLLLQYQRDMVEAAARAAQLSITRSPASPRLGPLGSPGPVTPWELEGEGSSGGWLERKSQSAPVVPTTETEKEKEKEGSE
ncbi:hypothetical protein O988_00088 [Pseudogymnoascus sp. VKM F-3808]|nr:hypothetical protein O988_00088 [Pseudogymnoascus sp. VKM F-3808]